MKTTNIILVLGCMTILSGCIVQPTPTSEPIKEPAFVLDIPAYHDPIESGSITVNGQTVELGSPRLRVGDHINNVILDKPAATFDTVATGKLSDLSGYTLIYSVPSLDTPVCTRQTKEIEAASKLFPGINFVTVSEDTPFALKRFCGDKNITNVHTFSDARTRQFGLKNGLYLTDYGLLTRAVIVIDSTLRVRYVDYVEEVTSEADLPNAFAFLKTLTNY